MLTSVTGQNGIWVKIWKYVYKHIYNVAGWDLNPHGCGDGTSDKGELKWGLPEENNHCLPIGLTKLKYS